MLCNMCVVMCVVVCVNIGWLVVCLSVVNVLVSGMLVLSRVVSEWY